MDDTLMLEALWKPCEDIGLPIIVESGVYSRNMCAEMVPDQEDIGPVINNTQ